MSKKFSFVLVALVLAWLAGPRMAADRQGQHPDRGMVHGEHGPAGHRQRDTLHAYINAGNAPSRSYWTKAMDRPDGGEDYWGGRMRGYIYPPQTGDYTFWTVSDDDSEVWLSTDDTPANIKMICNVEGWTDYQNWAYNTGAPGTTYKSGHQAGGRQEVLCRGLQLGWHRRRRRQRRLGRPGHRRRPRPRRRQVPGSPVIRNPEPMLMPSNPNPADGTVGVTAPLMTWTPGPTALFHDVYFGTDPNPPLVASQQMFAMYYHLQGLQPGTTYYWKVDEIEADGVTIYKGPVWKFTLGTDQELPSRRPPMRRPAQLPGLFSDLEAGQRRRPVPSVLRHRSWRRSPVALPRSTRAKSPTRRSIPALSALRRPITGASM